jgi:hypothetical protein
LPQPLADTLEFPRPQKLISAGTTWKFHFVTIRERNRTGNPGASLPDTYRVCHALWKLPFAPSPR